MTSSKACTFEARLEISQMLVRSSISFQKIALGDCSPEIYRQFSHLKAI